MDANEGMQRLTFHASATEDGAFLFMLRPYRGLRRDVLVDVMSALESAAPLLVGDQPHLPSELVHSLWAIVTYRRNLALDPGGALRRNGLISDRDRETLTTFLEDFGWIVAMLFDGGHVERDCVDRWRA